MRTTPFNEKKLLATRNSLRLLGSNQRVTFLSSDDRYNYGTKNWTISLVVNTGDTVAQRLIIDSTLIALYTFVGQIRFVAVGVGNLSCDFKSVGATRVTIIRTSSTLSLYLNNKIVNQINHSNAPLNLNGVKLYLGSSNAGATDCSLSNVVFLNSDLSLRQLDELHTTNIIPSSLHANVIAHYPLNHNTGLKAYDVVEQYNYAKATPLAASHGDLINYTNDEVGITNSLTQTAWQNIYSKKKNGLNFLKFNGVNGHAEIPALAGYTPSTEFIIAFAVKAPTSAELPNGSYQVFFNTHNSLSSWPNLIDFFWQGNSTTINLAGFYYDQNANVISNFTLATINRTDNVALNKTYTVVVTTYPNAPYLSLNWYVDGILISGSGGSSQVNASIGAFNRICFGFDRSGLNPSKNPIAKFILAEGTASDRKINLLSNCLSSDEYKRISGIKFDLDFGDVFLNAANYFIRDNSGNNYHAQLFNWTPVTDQPVRTEQYTGLPESRKALKFSQANAHYLSVSNFNPTKEKGYTYIIQSSLNADRVFQIGKDDPLIAKMLGTDFSMLKYLGGENGTKNYYWTDFANNGGSSTRRNNSCNTDLSKPNVVVCMDSNTFYEFNRESYAGYNIIERMVNPTQGWDEIIGNPDLFIGRIGTTSRYLDGCISFVGIWKGILKSYQIANIVNNGFIGNASADIMADCQLYLNFDEIINDAGVFKIRDWSPQNRTVVLNNYSLAEITPGDASYKLFDLDTLR